MAWIRIIPPEEATGRLAREYRGGLERSGRIYQILRVQSLAPESLAASMRLYLTTMHGRSGLRRDEREMLALVVSRANECFY